MSGLPSTSGSSQRPTSVEPWTGKTSAELRVFVREKLRPTLERAGGDPDIDVPSLSRLALTAFKPDSVELTKAMAHQAAHITNAQAAHAQAENAERAAKGLRDTATVAADWLESFKFSASGKAYVAEARAKYPADADLDAHLARVHRPQIDQAIAAERRLYGDSVKRHHAAIDSLLSDMLVLLARPTAEEISAFKSLAPLKDESLTQFVQRARELYKEVRQVGGCTVLDAIGIVKGGLIKFIPKGTAQSDFQQRMSIWTMDRNDLWEENPTANPRCDPSSEAYFSDWCEQAQRTGVSLLKHHASTAGIGSDTRGKSPAPGTLKPPSADALQIAALLNIPNPKELCVVHPSGDHTNADCLVQRRKAKSAMGSPNVAAAVYASAPPVPAVAPEVAAAAPAHRPPAQPRSYSATPPAGAPSTSQPPGSGTSRARCPTCDVVHGAQGCWATDPRRADPMWRGPHSM